MSDKKSRKELLKQEDAFIHSVGQSAEWVTTHKNLVIAGGVALVLGVVGVFGAIEYTEHRDLKASELYFSALKLKEAPVRAEPVAGETSFKTEAERDQAVRAALQKVVDEAGSSGVATLARVYVADYDEKLGEQDKALSGFLALADSLSPTDSLSFLAIERAAYLKERKGDVDGALQLWQRLVGNEKRFYSDRALYEQARLHATRGETDKARELLSRLEQDYKDSTVQEDVRELFAQVGRPPAPQASAAEEPEGQKATP